MILDKILVIDDDSRIISSVKMVLTEYEIIAFNNGDDALAFLKKPNNIQLIMLDVFLKDENGLDILQKIREINSDVRIIIMTAFGTMDIVVQALRYQADDFIEKPFSIDDLRDKVRAHLKKNSYHSRNANDQDYKVDRIKRFIEKNYANVSLEAIASELCLSEKYISRMFKKKNNDSYRGYKLKVKMEKAKNLLAHTSYSISQISEDLGYQNPESFMRMFKKLNNQTPSQYRRQS